MDSTPSRFVAATADICAPSTIADAPTFNHEISGAETTRADAAHGTLSGESPVNAAKSAVDRRWVDQGEVNLSGEFIAPERLPDDADFINACQHGAIGKSSHEQNGQLATFAPWRASSAPCMPDMTKSTIVGCMVRPLSRRGLLLMEKIFQLLQHSICDFANSVVIIDQQDCWCPESCELP